MWAGLLPPGSSPFANKRKIGLGSPQEEIEEILEWMSSLPDRSKIRLDANGSLNVESLQLWLDALEGVSGLEFVEQPLPVGQFEELKLISRETSVRFALDETVVSEGGPDALRQRGWEDIALSSLSHSGLGETIRFIKSAPEKSIVSTVFESPFGYEAVCRCALIPTPLPGWTGLCFKVSKMSSLNIRPVL